MSRDRDPEVLGPAELAAISRSAVARSYPERTVIVTEGDASDSLFVILEGRCRAYVSDENGREAILSDMGPGEYFGEVAMDKGPRSASVVTLEPAKLLVVPAERFRAFLAENPDFAFHFMQIQIHQRQAAGFQHQFAAGLQCLLQFVQVGKRRIAVIQHAHRDHRVEASGTAVRGIRQVLRAERQHVIRQIAAEMSAGHPLHDVQQRRIDPDHQAGARAEHAQAVVAVAAADVEDALAAPIHVRRQPSPFPVGAPFAVDGHTAQPQRSLAPGVQFQQRGAQRLAVGRRRAQFGRVAIQRRAGRDARQGVERGSPTGQVTVPVISEALFGAHAGACEPGACGPARRQRGIG